MKTLALFNGDLMLAQGGYMLFSGVDRIRQDLTFALAEEYGTDRFHPRWGSVVKQYLGNVITPQLEQLVTAEVNRVVQNYVMVQQSEVIRDSQIDQPGRFNTDDVVRSVLGLFATVDTDRINITLALETLARTSVTIRKQMVM